MRELFWVDNMDPRDIIYNIVRNAPRLSKSSPTETIKDCFWFIRKHHHIKDFVSIQKSC